MRRVTRDGKSEVREARGREGEKNNEERTKGSYEKK